MCSRSSADVLIGELYTEINNNANQVKCWFLRRGVTGVPEENLSVQSREPINAARVGKAARIAILDTLRVFKVTDLTSEIILLDDIGNVHFLHAYCLHFKMLTEIASSNEQN